MISWSRFTTKGIRDPRVGRDILYGAAMGGVFAILKLVQIRLHGTTAPPSLPNLVGLGGLRPLASFGLTTMDGAMFDPRSCSSCCSSCACCCASSGSRR